MTREPKIRCKKIRLLVGFLAVGSLIPQILGCIGDPGPFLCQESALSVSMTVGREVAVGTLTAEFVAHANAQRTCDDAGVSEAPTEIVAYRWDLDGDGVFEELTTESFMRVTFTEPGAYAVSVQVEDEAGMVARASRSVEVLETFVAADALDHATVTLASEELVVGCPELRPVCLRIGSAFDMPIAAEARFVHTDALVFTGSLEETDFSWSSSLTFCVDTGWEDAQVQVRLFSGETVRQVDLFLRGTLRASTCPE